MDCGAGLYPARRLATGALGPFVPAVPGGLPTRRRFPTCPTTSAEFPFLGKLSGIGQECLRYAWRRVDSRATSFGGSSIVFGRGLSPLDPTRLSANAAACRPMPALS